MSCLQDKAIGLFFSIILAFGLMPATAFAVEGDCVTTETGETIEVSLEEGESICLKFTAPSDGEYSFFSSGDADPCAVLYSDPELSNQLLENDDDAQDNNFIITYYLSENQSVYLLAEMWEGEDFGEFEITVATSEEMSSYLWLAKTELYDIEWTTNSPIAVDELEIYAYDDTKITSEDVIATWYDGVSGVKLDEAPSAVGYYKVTIEPSSESKYKDVGTFYFYLYDPHDIGCMSAFYDNHASIVDGRMAMPELTVYNSFSDEDLIEGEDFYIEGYCLSDDETWLEELPALPGYYSVKLVGMGDYTGFTLVGLTVADYTIYELEFSSTTAVNGNAIFRFTAPKDGVYCFSSVSSGDPYVVAYDSEDLTNEIAQSDDEGPNLNFILVRELAKNESVYLAVDHYSSSNAVSSVIAEASPLFQDTPAGKWYVKNASLHYVVSNGIMKGTSATTFSPNGKVTRAQVATILYRLAGEPEVDGSLDAFTDVKSGTWYSAAVEWAYETGVASGYGNGKFGPTDVVTREQLAKMLCGYAEKVEDFNVSADTTCLDAFADGGQISSWAKASVAWCVNYGVLTGSVSDDGAYMMNPADTATRAEAATMVMRFDYDILQADY